MARSLRIEYPGAYYHITSRGNERKAIFSNKADRNSFLSYLKSAYLRYGAVIHVYCLMDNHYHLLLETPKGNLSKIMQHINGAYTTCYNVKHKRSGHLFQGRYKAILVEADAYAGELSRYIHLNPVRAGMVDMPEKYLWSSYRYYIGKKKKPNWLYIDFIQHYFEHKKMSVQKNYSNFVLSKIFDDSDNPLENTVASSMLGSDSFVEKIIDKYLSNKKKDRDLPALRELRKIESIDLVYREVKFLLGDNKSISKKATLYICHQFSGKGLKEIGAHFGIGESAVTLASHRFKTVLQRDRKLRKNLKLIVEKLTL
jgi:REP element-mobilizing transposase RayT